MIRAVPSVFAVGTTSTDNFVSQICNYREPVEMKCEPKKVNASSFAVNMSLNPISFSLNVS
ncbi:hypothetical protein C5470_21255 [Photorhabdus stackebrandtii]|uniref:Uncharacterized protein n=1 Tax=Photorhabdus stackebrandtii TaxID=1123042 RepID=A0A7X5QQN1_9GAMM|nr:hypothetical protein [Photorhabdus stackebrandtii]